MEQFIFRTQLWWHGRGVVSEDTGLRGTYVSSKTQASRRALMRIFRTRGGKSTVPGRVYFGMSSGTVAGSATGGSNAIVATRPGPRPDVAEISMWAQFTVFEEHCFPRGGRGDAVAPQSLSTVRRIGAMVRRKLQWQFWHLYVSNTFDGGLHWTTTDATRRIHCSAVASGCTAGPIFPNLLRLLRHDSRQQGRCRSAR